MWNFRATLLLGIKKAVSVLVFSVMDPSPITRLQPDLQGFLAKRVLQDKQTKSYSQVFSLSFEKSISLMKILFQVWWKVGERTKSSRGLFLGNRILGSKTKARGVKVTQFSFKRSTILQSMSKYCSTLPNSSNCQQW